MTDTQSNSNGADMNPIDYSESDSRADAIAALAIVLILSCTVLYFVAGI